MILFQDQIIEREEVLIDLEDRGYQFGDGIYEVIRIYDGKPFTLREHLNRLERSADEIQLPLPFTLDEIAQHIITLIQRNSLHNGQVYLQITRGAALRNHSFPNEVNPVLTAYTKEIDRPFEKQLTGIKAILTEDIRWLRCDIKSLNLLGNVLGKQKAVDSGVDEAIFHRGELVTEGSSTNVFIIKNGVLQTHPPTNLILSGITRNVVLKLASELGIEVKEEAFTIHDLKEAEEVFVTSTTQEVMPIIEVNSTAIQKGTPGEITKKIQAAFSAEITLSK
ncbi:D-amino-acid transaminase [Bacillus taeanensis]|uniref:D-alanine aminotransferase n=2 Tax=Bacillus taeanensis TaxID=273032 RepID=A0A366XWT4_9BACI|nr:D-amino-acid transaminase [Bacillus taeanensis]RBW69229.1 D-amino-acid transaminase [Bacillus taeanensis]